MAHYITEEDVRMFILDRSPEDNDLDIDLSVTHEEIAHAMRRAAREYNSIPPYVGCADPDQLPADTNMFLDAIAEQIYLSEIARMSRNDFDYTAGGVSTNIEEKRIRHYKDLIKIHGERFRTAAQQLKITQNWSNAFGRIG